MSRLTWRKTARRDVADAALWYGTQAGLAVGERFLDAVDTALGQIALHPAGGSRRYAMSLQLEGLRFWPLKDFPYLIFYMDCDHQVDVLRVLHAQRDIPAWMGEGQ